MRGLHNIKDFGLTSGELARKYRDADDHPEYTKHLWRLAVVQQGVIHGFWDWCRQELMFEEEALDKDNPYNA